MFRLVNFKIIGNELNKEWPIKQGSKDLNFINQKEKTIPSKNALENCHGFKCIKANNKDEINTDFQILYWFRKPCNINPRNKNSSESGAMMDNKKIEPIIFSDFNVRPMKMFIK